MDVEFDDDDDDDDDDVKNVLLISGRDARQYLRGLEQKYRWTGQIDDDEDEETPSTLHQSE